MSAIFIALNKHPSVCETPTEKNSFVCTSFAKLENKIN